MKEIRRASEQALWTKAWLETLIHIQSWTFDQWSKPDMLGPLGQTIDMKRTSGQTTFHIHVQRYINRLDIDLIEKCADGTIFQIYKDMYRRGKVDVGRLTYDPDQNPRRIQSRRTKMPKYFIDFLERAGHLDP